MSQTSSKWINGVRTVGIAVGLLLTLAVGTARAAEVIKIGTLVPASSPWGQVFKTWAVAVNQRTSGALELQFLFNGAQGDEAAMVAKMKAGQLDGAAVTAVGLGKIYKPILALQMPGLITTWSKMDAVRSAVQGELEKGASDAGFSLLGWGDVGAVRLLSKGLVLKVPEDLRGTKPMMWRDDPMQPVTYKVIGGVSPVPLNVPEVLPQLNTGAINVVSAPPLVAEQLQWASKLDTVQDQVSALSIGALVISSRRLAALSEEQRSILQATGRVAVSALTKRIRSEDDAAYARLKGKLKVVTLSADERSRWDAINKKIRAQLKQGVFPADLVDRLEALAR